MIIFDRARQNHFTPIPVNVCFVGGLNDLYQTLFWIITMLESDPVQMAKLNFTKTLCAQAIWALCEDVQNMYGAPMTPEDFSSGKRLVFPTSTLANISTNLRHQEEFYRRGFPSQWLYTAAGTLPLVSTAGSQYGGGSFVKHGSSVGGSQPLPIYIPIADVDEMSGLPTFAPPSRV